MIRSPFHPGVFLQQLLEEHGITQSRLARHIGVRADVVSRICKHKRGMTPVLAMKLGAALRTSPELWMNLQTAFDLQRTIVKRPVKPLIARNGKWRPAA